MRQRTTLTSMTQFTLQVVPREDEDERQKEQPLELLKKAQRHALRLFCVPACLLTHSPVDVCAETRRYQCDGGQKLHYCLAVMP